MGNSRNRNTAIADDSDDVITRDPEVQAMLDALADGPMHYPEHVKDNVGQFSVLPGYGRGEYTRTGMTYADPLFNEDNRDPGQFPNEQTETKIAPPPTPAPVVKAAAPPPAPPPVPQTNEWKHWTQTIGRGPINAPEWERGGGTDFDAFMNGSSGR